MSEDLISRQAAIDANTRSRGKEKTMSKDIIYREDAIKVFMLNSKGERIPFVDCDNFPVEFPLRYIVDTLAALPSSDRPQEWIPCSVRLPDLNENGVSDMVLLCWSDGQMTVGAYQGGRTFVGQAWPTARDCRVTVTAWQPLPKPWKGADDE